MNRLLRTTPTQLDGLLARYWQQLNPVFEAKTSEKRHPVRFPHLKSPLHRIF